MENTIINYKDFQKKEIWKKIEQEFYSGKNIIINMEDEVFDNLPGDIEYLVQQAGKKNALIIDGGCANTDHMHHDIPLHKSKILKSLVKKPLEVKVVKNILKKNSVIHVYLNEDAKISVKIEQ